MFKRDITRIIAARLQEKRHFVQVLMGPRQVGKTTAIQQVLGEIDRPWRRIAQKKLKSQMAAVKYRPYDRLDKQKLP